MAETALDDGGCAIYVHAYTRKGSSTYQRVTSQTLGEFRRLRNAK